MDTIKLFKHGLIITAVASLIACGGGGGSSGPTYSGKTDPGKVTRENGDEVLGAAMDGASPGAQTANLSSDSSNPDQQKARLTGIAGRLKNLTQNAAVQLNSNNGTGGATAAIVPVNETTPGNCKGDGSDGEQIVSGSYDDETFDINMTMQYNQFCHTAETDGATMSGSISVTGSLNFDTDEFVFSMSFNNLTTEDGTDSLTMNGSIAMSGQGDTFVVTIILPMTTHIRV